MKVNRMLELKNITINAGKRKIVENLNMKIKAGEINVLFGPNAAGKSSLALALAGHPEYKITKGKIILDGENITKKAPEYKSRKGLFLLFQSPPSVEGVKLRDLLSTISNEKDRLKIFEKAKKFLLTAGLSEQFLNREINKGFSGGEKKKFELALLFLLSPKYVILDEPDSGVDIDSSKLIVEKINELKSLSKGVLLITHYPAILKNLNIDKVCVMKNGKIVEEGGREVAEKIEEKGFNGDKNE